jgi:hypothetical protein
MVAHAVNAPMARRVDYLLEEVRVLRDALATVTRKTRIHFTSEQRRRLAQSPNCNPHAERFVKTIRTECLDQFVIFGERHLRHLIREFLIHYMTERYHQGIGRQLICPTLPPSNDNATVRTVRCRSRLGGALNYYSREAA